MKRYIFPLILMGLFMGCSLKTTQKYKYRVDASNSFDSYTNYYLRGETRLAATSLKRAIQEAKQGYDLKSLSKIYLGECALHKAVLIDDKCENYIKIKHLLKKNTLQNYYFLIEGEIGKINIDKLQPHYRDFIGYLQKKNYKNAFNAIKEMKSVPPKLIGASIMKDRLSKQDILYIINEASSMGYKKAAKRWYEFLKTKSGQKERQDIDNKIKIFN